ncbi:MAG: putative Ig domain-containing protein, partial [Acidobacteriota bacterium]
MSRLSRLLAILSASILTLPALAQKQKEGKDLLDNITVEDPVVWVAPSPIDARAAAPSPRIDAFRRFQLAMGGTWMMWVDRVTENPGLIEGSGIPWIAGAGNRLVRNDHGVALRVEESPLVPRQVMVDKAIAFLRANPDLFSVDPSDLVVNEKATGPVLDYLYYIHLDWTFHGIPVEGAQIVFRVNHGNLVQVGSDYVSGAIRDLDPVASVPREEAWAIVRSYTHATLEDVAVDPGRLVVMPVSAYPVTDVANPAPIAYRLVWVLQFQRPGVMGTWEARVDAHSGQILVFKDANLYGQIQGGVFTTDKPQVEAKHPFAFADYGAGLYANAAGTFPGNSGTSTMSGQFVNTNDTCGAASLAANAQGLIDFGTSGGTDCTTPGFGGNGNTHSSRTQYFNVEAIREKARAFLPANAWLASQLGVNVNINQTCNAYWNGTTLNFFRSGGGCGNTGELPGVSLHEWGHGMDQNDGGPTGGSGESYADICWMVMGHVSCIGNGFFNSGNCTGYGDPCFNCTGIRQHDYAQHQSGNPHTPATDQTLCGGGGGPCGREVHCESSPSSEAMWDLAARDLITWGLDANSAWMLVDKLWFASRPTAAALFFSCNNNNSCTNGQLYNVLRVVDDCDGNLANGTPHASAIFGAMGRHQIGCSTAVNTDNNCACAALATPVLVGSPGNNQVNLTWGAIAGATSYDVLRNEVGCNSGFIVIANTAATSYTDNTAVNGYTYYYRIQAKSTAACPTSRVSNCVTVTPAAGPSVNYVTGSAVQQSDTGDNDGFPDNCETITVAFQLVNDGVGNVTNARVTSLTSTAPSVTVTSTLPINLGTINQGATANGTFTYTLSGAACAANLPFTMLVTCDQMSPATNTGTFSFTAEQDLSLIPSVVYSFETGMDGFVVTQGTFTRTNTYGGSQGTFALASSNGLDNQCDGVVSPVFRPTASSTLVIGTHFDIEPFSSGSWWDRANIGALVGATRTLMSPTGGRLYNASGANGPCLLNNQGGYAGTFTSWADSTGFNIAAFSGQNVQLDIEYGTDAAVVGTGFRIDNIRLTNVQQLVCDAQTNTCGGCPTITVNPASLPNGTQGVAYSQTVTASGGTAPYTFAISAGALPPGLALNAATGVISGNPTTPGTYNFTITATDANGCTGNRAYTVVIACPTITVNPASLPNGTVGTPYSQTVTASGGTAPYTFAISAGALPPGLALNAATGVISGTPTAPGTYNFTVRATDANGCQGTRAYTVVITCGGITVNPASLPNGTQGVPYSQTVTASGGTAPYTFAVTAGALPPGLALNAATGVVSGTPTTPGTYNFTITATDANSCTGSRAYTVTIACATITVNPASLPNGTIGVAYSQTVTASGGTAPYTFAVTAGALPAGLALNAATGVISGTPTATGTFNFTITATDANGCTGNRAYTVVISCGTITVNPASLPNGSTGVAYSQTVTASGGTAPYTFAVTAGALPPGLALNAATGVISGTPTATGTFNFTITATDANSCTGNRAYTVVISCGGITVNPASLPNGTVGVPYSQTVTASGGTAPYTFAVTAGALPTGLALNAGTGVISGTPTTPGAYNFTITATDANSCTGSQAYT